MSQIDDFVARCDAVAAQLGIARATLSTRLFQDGKRIDVIAAGGDVGTRRLERALSDLGALERGAVGRLAERSA